MEKIIKIIDNFKGKRIGVIGDLMLDYFIWGDVKRISAEAPVPVVLTKKESFRPGGAANTANNIAALGGDVLIIGVVGDDMPGKQLVQELKKRKINVSGILKDKNRPTIQKTRIIAQGQQIIRVDKEKNSNIGRRQEEKTINFIKSQIEKLDGLAISDYVKGFVTKNIAREIINLAREYKKPIIGDTKPKKASYFKNITVLCPNSEEAIEISGIKDIKKTGRKIQKQLNCNVLITQGSQGMTLFEGNKIKHFPIKAKEVFDVVGAGDTVTAVISLALTSGANLKEAVLIANYAAGISVGKIGTAVVSPEELKKELKNNEQD